MLKLFKKKVVFKNEKGEERTTWNIYLQIPNGELVSIKNAITKTRDGKPITKDYYTLLGNAEILDEEK